MRVANRDESFSRILSNIAIIVKEIGLYQLSTAILKEAKDEINLCFKYYFLGEDYKSMMNVFTDYV